MRFPQIAFELFQEVKSFKRLQKLKVLVSLGVSLKSQFFNTYLYL